MLKENEEEIVQEEEEDLEDIGDKMDPGADTRTVAYASYLQFLSKLEKTQNYRIVGKFVKQKYAQAKGSNPDQAEKLKEVYYILTYYANMKDDFIEAIGEKSKNIINIYKDKMKGKQFSLLSDVSPYIALATKEEIGGLLEKSGTLLSKIDDKGVTSQYIEGFHDKIIDIKRTVVDTSFPNQADFDQYLQGPESNPDVLKNLRIVGIAIAELFGPLMSKPKEYLNHLEKDVFKIKPPDAPTVPDAPARVDLDRPDTADFSRFLEEGLNRISGQERTSAKQSIENVNTAAEEDNKKKKFWEMMSSLEYHIYTDFSVLKNKSFEALNDAFKKNVSGDKDLLTHLADQIIEKPLKDSPPEDFEKNYIFNGPREFKLFLRNAKEKEISIKKSEDETEKASQQEKAREQVEKLYNEYEFISTQKEARQKPRSFQLWWKKAARLYSSENYIKSWKITKALKDSDTRYANPSLKDIEKDIRKRKTEKLKKIKTRDALALAEKYIQKEDDSYKFPLYELEDEYKDIIANPKKKSTSTPRGPDYSKSSFKELIEKMLKQEIIVEDTLTIEVLLEFEKFLKGGKAGEINENNEWSEKVNEVTLKEFDEWYEDYHLETWKGANPGKLYSKKTHFPEKPRSETLKDALKNVYKSEDTKKLFNTALTRLLPKSSETSKESDTTEKPLSGFAAVVEMVNLNKNQTDLLFDFEEFLKERKITQTSIEEVSIGPQERVLFDSFKQWYNTKHAGNKQFSELLLIDLIEKIMKNKEAEKLFSERFQELVGNKPEQEEEGSEESVKYKIPSKFNIDDNVENVIQKMKDAEIPEPKIKLIQMFIDFLRENQKMNENIDNKVITDQLLRDFSDWYVKSNKGSSQNLGEGLQKFLNYLEKAEKEIYIAFINLVKVLVRNYYSKEQEEEIVKRVDDELLEEQLTKILAPYLMERIKNRKPIDNRLINMLKPLKANKRIDK